MHPMNLTPHASWASLASAHRVHATYARTARTNATGMLAFWSAFLVTAVILAAIDPSIGRTVLAVIATIGIALNVAERSAASKRAEHHTGQADKYQRLSEHAFRNSNGTR